MEKINSSNNKLSADNIKLITNLPSTETGLNLAKRCKWCYNTMERPPRQKNDEFYVLRRRDPLKLSFCCFECHQEFFDWSFMVGKKKIQDRNILIQERKKIISCMNQKIEI